MPPLATKTQRKRPPSPLEASPASRPRKSQAAESSIESTCPGPSRATATSDEGPSEPEPQDGSSRKLTAHAGGSRRSTQPSNVGSSVKIKSKSKGKGKETVTGPVGENDISGLMASYKKKAEPKAETKTHIGTGYSKQLEELEQQKREYLREIDSELVSPVATAKVAQQCVPISDPFSAAYLPSSRLHRLQTPALDLEGPRRTMSAVEQWQWSQDPSHLAFPSWGRGSASWYYADRYRGTVDPGPVLPFPRNGQEGDATALQFRWVPEMIGKWRNKAEVVAYLASLDWWEEPTFHSAWGWGYWP